MSRRVVSQIRQETATRASRAHHARTHPRHWHNDDDDDDDDDVPPTSRTIVRRRRARTHTGLCRRAPPLPPLPPPPPPSPMPDAVLIVSYLRPLYLFSGAVATGRKRYEDQRAGVTCCVLMRRRDDANDSAASEALMIPHQPRGGTLASWRYGGESVLVVRRWFHRRPSITSTPLDRRGKRKNVESEKALGLIGEPSVATGRRWDRDTCYTQARGTVARNTNRRRTTQVLACRAPAWAAKL